MNLGLIAIINSRASLATESRVRVARNESMFSVSNESRVRVARNESRVDIATESKVNSHSLF